MSRPTAMTDEVLAMLVEAFKYGATDEEACAYADIAESTLYKYQVKHPEFTERKAQLKELPIFTARKSVVDRLPKDAKLAMDYLSRKRKDEFSQRSELTGKDGEALLPTPILGGKTKGGDVPANNSDRETS